MRVVLIAALLLAGCAAPEPEPTTTTTTAPVGEEEQKAAANATWGTPESKGLRPGINMRHGGSGCTTSFLFTYEGRIFMATAAHCVADGRGCDSGRELPTDKSTLELTDGTTVEASVAYHSWTTMSKAKESDPDTCSGNDFALLEIPAADHGKVHPASLHFQAPTGLATEPTPDIWGYGASILKQGQEEVHPKQGRHIGKNLSGWVHHVYLLTPGIPGDSGGHIMTRDGKALGIASTIIITPTPGSNHYTDIAKSLEYMLEKEGWAPEILTWPDFHASLV